MVREHAFSFEPMLRSAQSYLSLWSSISLKISWANALRQWQSMLRNGLHKNNLAVSKQKARRVCRRAVPLFWVVVDATGFWCPVLKKGAWMYPHENWERYQCGSHTNYDTTLWSYAYNFLVSMQIFIKFIYHDTLWIYRAKLMNLFTYCNAE